MTIYLIDTCVWRDFYQDRVSKSGNPLGKYANDFFIKIITKGDKVIFSEALVNELRIRFNEREINSMLNLLFMNKILVRIETTKEELIEAKKISEERTLPKIDCLNAIQARNHKAILISQDKHLLINLKDIAKVKKPQDLI